MPSILTHAFVAGSAGALAPPKSLPRWAVVAGVVCSVLPDIDTMGHAVGVRYGSEFGHRGFTHSILFALVAGAIAAAVVTRANGRWRWSPVLWAYLLFCIGSHGFLDAMTNAGTGVALLMPFSDQRFFLPWRPIQVAPLSVSRFIGMKGVAVALSEVLWVWLPMLGLVLIAREMRRHKKTKEEQCRG